MLAGYVHVHLSGKFLLTMQLEKQEIFNRFGYFYVRTCTCTSHFSKWLGRLFSILWHTPVYYSFQAIYMYMPHWKRSLPGLTIHTCTFLHRSNHFYVHTPESSNTCTYIYILLASSCIQTKYTLPLHAVELTLIRVCVRSTCIYTYVCVLCVFCVCVCVYTCTCMCGWYM